MLSQLPTAVAWGVIGTVVLSILLMNFGGVIRERLSRKPDPPPSPPPPSLPSPVAALPQAVDTASETSARFIDHLERQLDAEEKDHAKTRTDLEEARRQIAVLQGETQRLNLMLWQRGTP